MHKGIRFVVTVSRDDAEFLTNPDHPLTERAGCLQQLVEDRCARAGRSRVCRGEAAVSCVAQVDHRLAYHFLADPPNQRHHQLARVVADDSFLLCSASLAPLGAPAVEWYDVPDDQVEAATAQAAQLAHDADAVRWAPIPIFHADDRIVLTDLGAALVGAA